MAKVAYAAYQIPNRVFICINISSIELTLLRSRLPIDIFVSDLGKNGYLIDFPYNAIAIEILTTINNGPIGKAPIENIQVGLY